MNNDTFPTEEIELQLEAIKARIPEEYHEAATDIRNCLIGHFKSIRQGYIDETKAIIDTALARLDNYQSLLEVSRQLIKVASQF